MRVETEIKKWGNSLALRVTSVMAELPNFEPGTRVTVDVDSEGFTCQARGRQPPVLPLSPKARAHCSQG